MGTDSLPSNTKLATSFGHHDGNGLLHYPGGERHHIPAVLVVSKEGRSHFKM